MSWVKLDDQFFAHPKVIDLSKDAKLLHLAALTYCASQLTDGHITPGALRLVASMVDVDRATADELVLAGLWFLSESTGFVIHDYLDYNPSAEQVKRERAAAAKRQEDWRERQRRERRADDERNAVSNSASNAFSAPAVTAAPSPSPYPIPSPESRSPVPSSGKVDSTGRENRARADATLAPATVATPSASSLSPSAKPTAQRTPAQQSRPGSPQPQPDAREPPPNTDPALWTALLDGIGHAPVTRAERAGWQNWLRQLSEARASPDDIRQRCVLYRRSYGPEIPLTPKALVEHWSDFDGPIATTAAGQAASASVQALQQLAVDARRAEDNRLAAEKQRLARELADELARSRQLAQRQDRPAAHNAGRQPVAG